MFLRTLAAAGAIALATPAAATEGPTIPGPVSAIVTSSHSEGIEVVAYLWPRLAMSTGVRPRGAVFPSANGRCSVEIQAAEKLTAELARLLKTGTPVFLRDVREDATPRRVEATVTLGDGRDLIEHLAGAGLVKPTRAAWCGQ